MNVSLINPYIRAAMNSVIPGGSNIARRVIYDYELIYLERGEFTLVYDDVSYHCSQGDIIFIRPAISHSFQLDKGEISQPHIHFDLVYRPESDKIPISFKDIDKMTEDERAQVHKDYFSQYPAVPIVYIKNKDRFLGLFFDIISKNTDSLMKKGLMIELISVLINDNFPDFMEDKATAPIENQIKDYIDAGNGFDMDLDDFSKSFLYSKFYLEKRFKAAFGVSLISYRNEKRMEYAARLLKKHSVSKVAEKLGFKSIYSFSRAYKTHYGVPPTHAKKI